jgi:methylated-DNA-[protein]-cysteine S-methyltransferase
MLRVRLGTPIGELTAFVRGEALVALDLPGTRGPAAPVLSRRFPGEPLEDAGDAIDLVERFGAYLAGDLRALDAIAVDPGGTAFQRAVWAELRRIPAGGTRSYAEVARAIGAPSAVRAVGAANGANPIAIVIPCHRVVASGGGLGGYGGGLARKRWLLEHERAALPGGARLQRSLFLPAEHRTSR